MAGDLTVDVLGVAITRKNLVEMIGRYPKSGISQAFVSFLEEALTLPESDPGFFSAKPAWYGASVETSIVAHSRWDLVAIIRDSYLGWCLCNPLRGFLEKRGGLQTASEPASRPPG